jgi:hypothetical protein
MDSRCAMAEVQKPCATIRTSSISRVVSIAVASRDAPFPRAIVSNA